MAPRFIDLSHMGCAALLWGATACGSGQGAQAPDGATTVSTTAPAVSAAASGGLEFCGRSLRVDEKEVACTRRDVADLSPLKKLPSLESLVLTFVPLTDLEQVAELTSLKVLVVLFSRVTDLKPLQKLSKLESLALSYAPVADLSPIAALTSLTELDINGTQVTDLAPVQSLTRLEKLDLSETPVQSLEPLHALSALRELNLTKTRVSAASIAALKAALPKVVVQGP